MNAFRSFLALILLTCFAAPFRAADSEDRENLYRFLTGDYTLIGKGMNGGETYTGSVTLRYNEKSKCLDVVRTVAGKAVPGIGKIEVAMPGESKVLRISFIEGKTECIGTYLFQGDLDNYARLSGMIYRKKGETKEPGMEALFIRQ